MALCAGCRTGISPSEAKRARTEKDEDGRLKGVFHYKCWFKRAKIARFKVEGRDTGPDAYEVSRNYRNRDDLRLSAEDAEALARRQAELAEDRKKEAAPETSGDWRDQIEGEI